MTKDVLITVSGLHYEEDEEFKDAAEPIEVVFPALYYYKNGKHYILYEEPVEGMPGTIKNKIKIKEGESLEVSKSGVTSAHMLFEKDKIGVTQYETPYGMIVIGTYTNELRTNVTEERIEVYARYEMDVSGEKIADCEVRIRVEARK